MKDTPDTAASEQPVGPASPAPSVHRFYCKHLPSGRALSDSIIQLERNQAEHAHRVLRLRANDPVELFNGEGTVASGRIERDGRVQLERLEQRFRTAPTIDLAVALPKGGRADDLVPALSQLGINRLIPLRSARGLRTPRPQRLERFEKAAIESAKQCRRDYLLRVDAPAAMETILREDHDLRLLARPDGTALPLRPLSGTKRVLILIGPEGGWTTEELEMAERHGCLPWKIGPHVLRIETAAAAAAAIARYLSLAEP